MITDSKKLKEANELLDLLEHTVEDLDKFSVYNDDIFNSETYEMEELVKRARRQIMDWNEVEGINRTMEETGGEE